MSEEPRTVGVVVGHAAVAEGLISAVRSIAGSAADGLKALSNEGKSPEALRAELDALLEDRPAVIFVDLASGSCGLAAAACCRNGGARALVSGVNLPMLLHFVFNRERPLDELTRDLVERGRASILAPGPHAPPS